MLIGVNNVRMNISVNGLLNILNISVNGIKNILNKLEHIKLNIERNILNKAKYMMINEGGSVLIIFTTIFKQPKVKYHVRTAITIDVPKSKGRRLHLPNGRQSKNSRSITVTGVNRNSLKVN